jgi:hypothetical protein
LAIKGSWKIERMPCCCNNAVQGLHKCIVACFVRYAFVSVLHLQGGCTYDLNSQGLEGPFQGQKGLLKSTLEPVLRLFYRYGGQLLRPNPN